MAKQLLRDVFSKDRSWPQLLLHRPSRLPPSAIALVCPPLHSVKVLGMRGPTNSADPQLWRLACCTPIALLQSFSCIAKLSESTCLYCYYPSARTHRRISAPNAALPPVLPMLRYHHVNKCSTDSFGAARTPVPPCRVRGPQERHPNQTRNSSGTRENSRCCSVSQSLSQSVTQSVSHSVSQSVSHSVTQSLSQSLSHSVS